MVKFIFFTLIAITFGVLIFPYLYNGITYFGQAIEMLVQASAVILAIAMATFSPMTQYNYIMYIFYLGIFIMIINFIFKIITNHYISENDDKAENKNSNNKIKEEKKYKNDYEYFKEGNKEYERRVGWK